MVDEDVATKYKEQLQKADGVIHNGPAYFRGGQEIFEFVVSQPNQIKSATDNVGTYSTTNNDIRFRTIPQEFKQSLQQKAYTKENTFNSLSADTQMYFANQGITEEEFNSWSKAEKDYAKECAGI
jgi:hypothetical protein